MVNAVRSLTNENVCVQVAFVSLIQDDDAVLSQEQVLLNLLW